MAAVVIANEDELAAWLKDKPREWAVAIAARAALRVLPLWLPLLDTTNSAVQWERSALNLFRSVAIAKLASANSSAKLNSASYAAEAAYDSRPATRSIITGSARQTSFALSADSAHAAALSMRLPTTPKAVSLAASSAEMALALGHRVWDAVSADIATLLASNNADFNEPLWPRISIVEQVFEREWQYFKKKLLDSDEGWSVWTEWYDCIWQGQQPW